MKIVYKKDVTKKYTCHYCGKPFNWNEESCRYGNYEGSGNNVNFCSDKCGITWIENGKKIK